MTLGTQYKMDQGYYCYLVILVDHQFAVLIGNIWSQDLDVIILVTIKKQR
jgi:hypothetical protein